MSYSFEQIEPLIVKEEWNGPQVSLEFKAPNQNEPLKAGGAVTKSQEEMQKQAMAGVGKSMATSAAVGAGQSLLTRLTGIPILGSILSIFTGSAATAQTTPKVKVSEEERREAILKAFEPYTSMYDYQNGEWSYRG